MTLDILLWKRLAGWTIRLLLTGLLAVTLQATPARAAGVVGGSCTEADLNAALAGGGLVTFSCGAAPHTILISSQKIISAGTTLDGGGLITLTGGDSTRLFSVNGGVTLTLNNLVLEHGNSGGAPGGAVYDSGTLIVNHTTVQDSQTSGLPGGAIAGSGGAITLTNSLVQGNHGYDYGAISTDGDLVIQHSQIVSNAATLGGGGVHLRADGHGSISDSQIISNTALPIGAQGGGIFNSGALTLTNVSLSHNSVSQDAGGGIFNDSAATLWVVSSTIDDNFAGGGGGLYNSGQAVLTNDALDQNTAGWAVGGGILNTGVVTLANDKISINSAVDSGGGIYNAGLATLNNSTLSSNSAYDDAGAGIFNATGATFTVTNSTLSYNAAGLSGRLFLPGAGGGIFNQSGAALWLTNSTLSGNSSTIDPSGGLDNSGAATLTNDTLSDNPTYGGHAIYFNALYITESMTLKNTILTDSPSGNCFVDPGSVVSITSNGFNLSSDGSCAAYLNQTGDRNNQPALLYPLANNGGPTQTHLPQLHSPVIDHGTNLGCPATDQRGVLRPQGAACDIGAVEVLGNENWLRLFLPQIRR